MPLRSNVQEVFSTGIPSAIATLLFDVDYIVLDKLMSSYNDIALAAVGIVLKVERLPLNTGVGICQGMVPIVAYALSSQFASWNVRPRLGAACSGFPDGDSFPVCSRKIYEKDLRR